MSRRMEGVEVENPETYCKEVVVLAEMNLTF
jgi:hypothetical protein